MTSKGKEDVPLDGGLEEGASFEAIVTRLRSLVRELEEGELSLETSLQRFEEGVKLSRLGARRLDEAERKVEELLGTEDELYTEEGEFEGEES